jgi:hypothetical protein
MTLGDAGLETEVETERRCPALRAPHRHRLPALCRTVWAFTGHSACACRLIRPLLTSAARSAPIARCSVHTYWVLTESQISRGKFDRFQHTTGGSTLAAPLMDQHFVVEGPLVPATTGLISPSCSSARAFALRFFRTRLAAAALALRYPSPPSGW